MAFGKHANTATDCAECGKKLELTNKYIVNPMTGGFCVKRAWCQECFEKLRSRFVSWAKLSEIERFRRNR